MMENYLDEAPAVFFAASDEGILLQVNDTLCRRLRYTREELTGRKLEQIFTVPTRIFQQTHFFPLLKMQGKAEEIFVTLKPKQGEDLPVILNAERKWINGKALSFYAGIVVHHRKKFEEELLAAKKAAEKALHENSELIRARQVLQQHAEDLDRQMELVKKQNEELRQFNRVVTHDLQEPLRKLLLFTGLLADNSKTQPEPRVVEKIRAASEQMRSIVSGLQQYVWLTETTIHPEPVDLNRLFHLLEQGLSNEYPDVSIQIKKEDLPVLVADAEQLEFLLHELLANAVRFRKNPGLVHIGVWADQVMLNRFRSVPDKYKYLPYLRLHIRDEGVGFNARYQDQVFELFRKLHPQSGRGIGLALVKKIVDNHQGQIDIESSEQKGTVVTISLPLDTEETARNNKNMAAHGAG